MYGPIYDASVANALLSALTDIRQITSPDNGLTPVFLLRNGFPQVAVEQPGPGFGAVRVGQTATFAPDFMANDHRNNYAHHFNFAVQQSLFGGTLVELGYMANLGHNLTGPAINTNEIRPELRGAVQDQRLRPFPQYGNVTWISPNWGNSSYHALTAKAERRFSSGLNLLTIYTWAKFLDDVEANSEIGGVAGNGYQSYYARTLDKALSGNDIRHRLVSSFVYELPVGRSRPLNISNRVLDGFIGGWSLGMISELRSGLPYGVTEASNRLNAFSHSQRPNRIHDPVLSGDRPRAEFLRQWFDTSAFVFSRQRGAWQLAA